MNQVIEITNDSRIKLINPFQGEIMDLIIFKDTDNSIKIICSHPVAIELDSSNSFKIKKANK